MKWKKPKYGDKRTVKKFAWLPVECEGSYIAWMEWYDEEQVWITDYYTDRGSWDARKRKLRVG